MRIVRDPAPLGARLAATATAGEAIRQVALAAGALVREFKAAVLQDAIQQTVTAVLGPPRHRSAPARPTPWRCPRCGPRQATDRQRNGTYPRAPLSREGPLPLRIPQLVCRTCRHAVPFTLSWLPRFQRVGWEVDAALTEAYLLGHSYRSVAAHVVTDTTRSPMTAWRALQRVGGGPHRPPPVPSLAVVGLDEVHLRIRGQPAWLLVARGTTTTGQHVYLGAVLSPDRTEAAWVQALDGLGLAEVPAAVPLMADGDSAIEQAVATCLPGRRLVRCAWHVLHNVADWVREHMPGDDHADTRRTLRAAAHAVVDAPDARTRHHALRALADAAPWLAQRLRPAVVRVPYAQPGARRTNNGCERGFREWRRRTRPMDGFGSWVGARTFAALWMRKENARLAGADWRAAICP